ncbi:MAG TPA: bile acid:sodium symporter [Streptosporangiaceae bacterium]|nr:bile acid:sodium symporter [Streptosporangiaceae bacterium]
MDCLHLLFNAVTVIFIAATMFTAGLGATIAALRGILTNVPLLLLALLANTVGIPLLGWGIGALFGLPPAAFIALVLVASSPGGPFGAKLAMVQKGDVVAGAAMQVLLATLDSITFGPTVNGILTAAKVGTGVSLDVAALVGTVALLQLVPFAIGLLRRYATPTARSWHPTAAAISNVFGLSTMMTWNSWYETQLALGAILLPPALAAAVRLGRRPGWRQAAILGAVLGAALLTDQELATWPGCWPRRLCCRGWPAGRPTAGTGPGSSCARPPSPQWQPS